MRAISFRFVVGTLVLLVGAMIAVDTVFGVHFPLVPLVLAVLLMAVGARLMIRTGPDRGALGQAWLADRVFVPEGDRDQRYDILFGRGVVDLTNLPEPDHDKTISVDTVFGAAVIKLAPNVPVEISGHSMFGEVRMPDRTMAAMGSIAYKTPTDHAPKLHLRISTVFGNCQVLDQAKLG
ncbi:MAG TPA: LiaF domain-containing protein [Kofleriaceae bacterium]|nr:LiaF domain-containing protein [Kofleriaceae bacterium]